MPAVTPRRLHRFSTAVLLTATLPLALSACGAQEDSSSSQEPVFSSQAPAEDESSGGDDVASAATPSPSESTDGGDEATTQQQDKDRDAECTELPNDPRKVYASGTAPGRMPADDGSDFNYWIADIENSYDPCATISWIIFRGSMGDLDGPAGTGASIADGIAFYVNGAPAKDMSVFDKVESITPVSDNEVDFTWGERSRSTAEGITAHHTVRLRAQGDSLEAVSGEVEEFNKMWVDLPSYQLGTYD
ncbi:hypothetical protein [Corynebacterium sp. MSK158]|uniref:hypothetical protein n=1 Tax=Corynebacterium sp. MSK158 TaxID=3050212 RepID=UPI00254CF839|nr:hypothetical protein [Corynebacterium sp. MSK158]MDK8692868.1 hypothetical protein [Corynebacterium sp. MSK158]